MSGFTISHAREIFINRTFPLFNLLFRHDAFVTLCHDHAGLPHGVDEMRRKSGRLAHLREQLLMLFFGEVLRSVSVRIKDNRVVWSWFAPEFVTEKCPE